MLGIRKILKDVLEMYLDEPDDVNAVVEHVVERLREQLEDEDSEYPY